MRYNVWKTLLVTALAFLLCWGLVACNTNPPETPPAGDPPSQEEPKDDPNGSDDQDEGPKVVTATYPLADVLDKVKIYGRTSLVGTGLSCDFTASGIEFSAYLEGDVKVNVSCTADTYFTVYVDGERMADRCLVTPTDKNVTVASFAQGGKHTIRLLKQTEPWKSLSVLESLEMTGYWQDPPRENDFVEFIGDSITCGYANLAEKGNSDADNNEYEDGTQAFAYLAAEQLGVDFSIVGCSGIGLVNTYRETIESDFYTKQSYYRSTTEVYTPTRTPNFVVINLGTNEQNLGTTSAEFKQAVKELIQLIRTTYGRDVKIVWCYNMMKDGMYTSAEQAIEELGGEQNGLYLCRLTRNTAGGASHPNLEGHKTAAEELVEFINEKRLVI